MSSNLEKSITDSINSSIPSSSRPSSSTQQRPILYHSSTSYATQPPPPAPPISSNSQNTNQNNQENLRYSENQYQDEDEDFKNSKEFKSYSSYPPTFESNEYLNPNLNSNSNSNHLNPNSTGNSGGRRGNRNRSVSLSLNEMWDKSRNGIGSVCSFKGENAIGKGMILGWISTTLLVLGILGWWRKELFQSLDSMSTTLEASSYGHAIFFLLILITTIPPIPLYSTLIVLSGYTFGVWQGFLISYLASLVGAVGVFIISRCWLRDVIGRLLSCSQTSSTLLSLLSSHPHLLLLIRIAPYPYNLLNVILASSPSLSLKTYTACTALSLCKLVLHTWIGSGIHNLSEAYGHSHNVELNEPSKDDDQHEDDQWESNEIPGHKYENEHKNHHHPLPPWIQNDNDDEWEKREQIKTYSTWFGILLCLFLFIYLTYLTKKALKKAQQEQEQQEQQEEMIENGQGLLNRTSFESEEEEEV
ncbi:uncharacterized protein I206_107117 [Kwoniella pini CBS 10737]|uniref:Golgi apparatus membrane protein TVP38 n=1 Tax=Kwoniella pini CBS 10737 TaxID=1296096 RepID=A0A1B9HZ77_9TREE|nr:uncharacterized protein I206_05339 [Kwoniella pini CBS 10737]OCF48560.1 hypothetical protein I206_05339 [Kwoniella pini CBS 10737]